MFGVCLLIFIGLCIYHASEKELPAGYHNNWRLEAHDSQLVREGKMTQRQFLKNMDNGKYRQNQMNSILVKPLDKNLVAFLVEKIERT